MKRWIFYDDGDDGHDNDDDDDDDAQIAIITMKCYQQIISN